MRRLVLVAVLLVGSVLPLSCGTAYRYEYYDYGEKTIDEKNREREEKINRRFRGMVPGSGRFRRR